MKATLESRIQRIAEDYGDPLLRIYATEVGVLEAEHEQHVFKRRFIRGVVLPIAVMMAAYAAAYWGSAALLHLAKVKGWL